MSDLPKRIWLPPNAGNDGETLWCDNPAPGAGMDEADAIEYVRADALIEAEKRGAERMRDQAAQYHYNFLMTCTGLSVEKIIASTGALRALPLTEETPDAE